MFAKSIYLARRNPTTSHDEFRRNWRAHAALASTLTAMTSAVVRVIQCASVQNESLPLVSNHFDGVNLLTMNSLVDIASIAQHPDIEVMLRDELRVFEAPIPEISLATLETALIDGQIGSYVLIGFVRRNHAILSEDFQHRWTAIAAEQMISRPAFSQKVGRFVINQVVVPSPRLRFDSVFEVWFDRLEDVRGLLADPEFARWTQAVEGSAVIDEVTLFCGEINLLFPREADRMNHRSEHERGD